MQLIFIFMKIQILQKYFSGRQWKCSENQQETFRVRLKDFTLKLTVIVFFKDFKPCFFAICTQNFDKISFSNRQVEVQHKTGKVFQSKPEEKCSAHWVISGLITFDLGMFSKRKKEISVIVYRIKFTKHSRALVSSSTIELVLQLFSSF